MVGATAYYGRDRRQVAAPPSVGRVQLWAGSGIALVVVWIALLTMPATGMVAGIDHALSGLLLQAAGAVRP